MIYSKEEQLPLKDLEDLILERLKKVIGRVRDNVPMYQKMFEGAGVEPRHLETLADIRKFPFTTKSDLWDQYPFGALSVPKNSLLRVHTTSGTAGKPILVGYTRQDIDTWAELMARALISAGVHEEDIVLNTFNYGLATTGLGIHYGAERIGALVIPASDGNFKRQIMLLEDANTTVLCSTPGGALHLATDMKDSGLFKEHLNLRVGVFGAEPWSENMRAELEDILGIYAIDLYGLSEMMGPGVGCECVESRSGPHIFMDHFLPEIIDPDTGENLHPGEEGELVFTTLTKEAFPLIRYRTGDISRLDTEPCTCGRTMWRMKRIMGRTDDMIIIRGVNVFPSQIESVLLRTPEVEPHYRIEIDRIDGLDNLTVTAEVTELAFTSGLKSLPAIEERIKEDFQEALGIPAKIKLVEPKSMRQVDGITRKVIDRRKI